MERLVLFGLLDISLVSFLNQMSIRPNFGLVDHIPSIAGVHLKYLTSDDCVAVNLEHPSK
jgi:hypothetical protein